MKNIRFILACFTFPFFILTIGCVFVVPCMLFRLVMQKIDGKKAEKIKLFEDSANNSLNNLFFRILRGEA